MGDETRRKAEELFCEVVKLPPEKRQEFLSHHGDDPRVRAEVELLLKHDEAEAGSKALTDEFPVLDKVRRIMESPETQPLSEGTRQLGDFRIVREIGRGGMGAVYEAIQDSLSRRVALKILPDTFALDPDRLERFRREARATARIHHSNIVPIYEVGEVGSTHYYAMEFIDGPSLDLVIAQAREHVATGEKDSPTSDPTYIRGVLEQMATLAEGLEEAHAQGLVHRDIKPSNILVDKSGRYMLVDFGLVRDVEAETITRSGELLGTLNYMSPEQISGGEIDARTDVYSLGATLFELLTLERPFGGENAHEIQSAILFHDPPPPRRKNTRLDRDMETIILRCLEKKSERRYPSAGEFAADLRRLLRSEPIVARPQALWEKVGRRAWRRKEAVATVFMLLVLVSILAVRFLPKPQISLAVLPFVNESAAPDMEYLSDGITENLIFRLGQLPRLKVKSSSLVFRRYKDSDKEPQAIGRELDVDAVLAGRVWQRGDELAIRVELLDARKDETIWGNRYVRKPKLLDLEALEEEISRQIVDGLRVTLRGNAETRVRRRYTQDPETYLLYCQGRHLMHKFTEKDLRGSIDRFQKAIDRDPRFALAYVGMAQAYIFLAYAHEAPKDVFPQALAHALEAERLDPTLGEAHAALGAIRLHYNWNWAEAQRELDRALELNPRCAESFPCYAHCLDAMGRPDEAMAQIQRTLLDVPDSLILQAELGCSAYYAGRYEEAIEYSLDRLELEEDPSTLYLLARAYGQLEKYTEAIEVLTRALSLQQTNYILAELGYVFGRSGERVKAEAILQTLLEKEGFVDPYDVAFIHIGLGDKDNAIAALQEAYEVKSAWIPWINVEPKFLALHSDSRFHEILANLGLPSA